MTIDQAEHRSPAVIAHIRQLSNEYFATGEASAMLGISPTTLRRLAKQDGVRLGPTAYLRWGSLTIALYNIDAVARLDAHLAALPRARDRGRRRRWDDVERVARHNAYNKIGYRRRRAGQLRGRGEDDAANRLLIDAQRLLDALHCERAQRKRAESDCGGQIGWE